MSVIVFSGPTLREAQVRSVIDCDVRPPAARGDILAATFERPRAIGFIDGCFDRVASVWHKEILWALSQGIHVYGASSMGALRACELGQFGMVGVGRIFEMYRSGRLEDDDEVAVAHATAEHDHRTLSDALVNIRATTAEALRHQVITDDVRRTLDALAKALPYPDRRYSLVISEARRTGAVDEGMLGDFERWLKVGRVDQKEADALELLHRLRDDSLETPHRPAFCFSWTDSWEALWQTVVSRNADVVNGKRADVGPLVDELCLRGEFGGVWENALLRAAALTLAAQNKIRLNAKAIEAVIEEFRRERGLIEGESFQAWLREQQLADDEQAAYFTREATYRAVLFTLEGQLSVNLTDHLRGAGQYGALLADANERRRVWHRQGLDTAVAEDAHLDDDAIWNWFFANLGREVPSDLSAYVRTAHVDAPRLRALALKALLSHRLQRRPSRG